MIAWAFPLIKGVLLGLTALWVIGNTDFSVTERALIVAGVSGFLGILAVVIGQLMGRRHGDEMARLVLEAAEQNHLLLDELRQRQQEQTGKLNTITKQTNGESE